MEEFVVLLIVFFIVLATIAIPFIWGLIPVNKTIYKRDYSKIAIYLSVLVVVSFLFAYILKLNIDSKGMDWPRFIILAGGPIATIAGFYMVYQTFKVQSENATKEEIHNLIKLQNRILGEIVLIEKEIIPEKGEKVKDEGVQGEENIEKIKPYSGRVAFKKIIDDFNTLYPSYQKIWNSFILKSIEDYSISSIEKVKARKFLNDIFVGKTRNEKKVEDFIKENFQIFLSNSLKIKYFKALTYEELLAATLYIRIYFDEDTGDEYLKNCFHFKSTSLFSIFSPPYFNFQADIESVSFEIIDKSNYDFLSLSSPFSGSTQSNLLLKQYESSGFSKKLLEFYPEQLLSKTKENSQDLHLHLDTYFRNLFNAYKTVAKIRNKSLREDAARLLRTQISSYEQAVIFLNSLSPMGSEWQKVGGLNLFRELKVIKNIPKNVIKPIQPWDVYSEKDGFEFEFLNKK